MAGHEEHLQEVRKRVVAARRNVAARIAKSEGDTSAMWNDLLRYDAVLQVVDRGIEDESRLRSSS